MLGIVLGSLRELEERTSDIKTMSGQVSKITSLEKHISRLTISTGVSDRKWMSVDELINYIPTHPSKQTVYAWMRENKIPYYKREKSCYFLTVEIDSWLAQKPNMSIDNIKTKAAEYIKKHPKKK